MVAQAPVRNERTSQYNTATNGNELPPPQPRSERPSQNPGSQSAVGLRREKKQPRQFAQPGRPILKKNGQKQSFARKVNWNINENDFMVIENYNRKGDNNKPQALIDAQRNQR